MDDQPTHCIFAQEKEERYGGGEQEERKRIGEEENWRRGRERDEERK